MVPLLLGHRVLLQQAQQLAAGLLLSQGRVAQQSVEEYGRIFDDTGRGTRPVPGDVSR
ncbi:hypothetical protein QQY24_33325 [Streptomyces sp. TG1A-8]|uniref:hypothetical protein n=1 Tax=Streptomyces sp. TG1A-8 TaxID=3051385 RepID=UPI00265C5A31|nr:hypothetical protein [Streptomyces sp. TG1A-8]MDO0929973.1 hypothetical protein [Streptomyces sp. TG1A-8]